MENPTTSGEEWNALSLFLITLFGPNGPGAGVCCIGSAVTSWGLIMAKMAWIRHENSESHHDHNEILKDSGYIMSFVLQFGGMAINCVAFRLADGSFIGVLSSVLRMIISAWVANVHLNEPIRAMYVPTYLLIVMSAYPLLQASPPPMKSSEMQLLGYLCERDFIIIMIVGSAIAWFLFKDYEYTAPYEAHCLGISSGIFLSLGVIIRVILCKLCFCDWSSIYIGIPLFVILIGLMIIAMTAATLSLKKGNVILCNIFFEGVVTCLIPFLNIMFYNVTLESNKNIYLFLGELGLISAFFISFIAYQHEPSSDLAIKNHQFRHATRKQSISDPMASHSIIARLSSNF